VTEEQIEALKTFMGDPPLHARRVCFMYRQAIAKRQQAEQAVQRAQAAIKAAQMDATKATAQYNSAVGVEQGLHDAVVALMDPEEEDGNLVRLPAAEE
jgi:hypothetical protein